MRFTILLLTLFSAVGFLFFLYKKTTNNLTQQNQIDNTLKLDSLAIEKAIALQPFLTKNNYNTNFSFIINMAVPSNNARFYVYSYVTKSIILKGLVCHGKGSDMPNGFTFKNEIGSNASSKGNYKIGAKYNGTFGTAYKLYGLESSNSNAFNRFVVLHAHDCVPDTLSIKHKICRSDGCPTIAPQFLHRLSKIVDTVRKPIILNIDYIVN